MCRGIDWAVHGRPLPLRALRLAGAGVAVLALTTDAFAAPPWVDRHLTLPSGNWAFDAGLGVGHTPDPVAGTAAGINAEMAVGVTDRVELGARTGIRFGDAPERSIQADRYGRLFYRQMYASDADVLANPELSVRGAPVRGRVVELALEGRVVLPFASASGATLLFGVPLAFHVGRRVRLDTGAYVPIVWSGAWLVPARGPFAQFPTSTSAPWVAVSLPLDVWIQATPRVWIGPMTGIVLQRPGDTGSRVDASLGVGFGYEITRFLDFKAMVLFPTITDDSRFFGLGAGVQIRIE